MPVGTIGASRPQEVATDAGRAPTDRRYLEGLISVGRRLLESDCPGATLPDDIAPLLARVVACALAPPDRPFSVARGSPPHKPAAWQSLEDEAAGWLGTHHATLPVRLGETEGLPTEQAARALLAEHRHSIAAFAADTLTSHPLAPPTRLLDASAPQPDVGYHAIVFERRPHSSHEFWPLLVDALQARAAGSIGGIAVAAHASWFGVDGRLSRAAWYDAGTDRIAEADLSPSVRVSSALLLLGPRDAEGVWHLRTASELMGHRAAIANSSSASLAADDKWFVHDAWASAGVPSPRSALVTRGSMRESEDGPQNAVKSAAAEVAAWGTDRDLLVKPRHGTGAAGVSLLRGGIETSWDQVAAVLLTDDAIIQERRGDLRYVPDRGVPLPATLRLHATSDAEGQVRIESGYVHVADDPEALVASVARSGRAYPIVHERLRLIDPGDDERALNDDDVLRITDTVVLAIESFHRQAAHTRGERLRLAGLDMLVESGEDDVAQGVALEINSRPAGLCHSRFLTPGWVLPGEPGVSIALWDGRG